MYTYTFEVQIESVDKPLVVTAIADSWDEALEKVQSMIGYRIFKVVGGEIKE